MKPRSTWPLLAKKAEDALGKRRQELQAAIQATQKHLATRQRLLGMIDTYKAKLQERQQQPLSVAEATNFREFMAQLLRLVERVELDIQQALAVQEQAKRRVTEAEIELFKMQAMVDKDLKAVAAYQKKQEQRQLDALGFARRTQHPARAGGRWRRRQLGRYHGRIWRIHGNTFQLATGRMGITSAERCCAIRC